MKYFRLIAKNALRNRRRTTLTLLSVAVSLFLLVCLRTLVHELEGENMMSDQSARRLITRHAVSLQLPIPVSHRRRIESLPEVEIVSEYQWFATYFRDPKNMMVIMGVDPDFVGSDPEYPTTPAHLAAYRADRQALLVPEKMLQLYDWKVGDRLTFQGSAIPIDLELVIRGTFAGPAQSTPIFHYRYFNEAIRKRIPARADLTTTFMVRVRRREDIAQTARAIDEMFRNAAWPTRTESEKDFLLSFTSMLGNLRFFIVAISIAVTFAILLVTANTMAMTVRERIGEIAILKTLGFRRHHIFGLVVGEASVIALGGGLLGMAAAIVVFRVFDIYDLTQGIIQHFEISPSTLTFGAAVALCLGIVSSAFPAWRAARMSIVAGMRE